MDRKGVNTLKVIIEKNGINAHSVNDKAVISHGIAQKTELSKKSGGRLEKQQIRAVGGAEKTAKAEMPNGSLSAAAQKREHFAKGSQKSVGSTVQGVPKEVEIPKSGTVEGNSSFVIKGDTATLPLKSNEFPKSGTNERIPLSVNGGKPYGIPKAADVPKSGMVERKPLAAKGEKAFRTGKPKPSASAAGHWKQRLKNKRLKLAPRKKYKVLNNGVVNSGTITKRRARVIYSQVPAKLKKLKLKRLQKRSFKINKSQAELMQMAMGGSSVSSGGGRLKRLVPMGVSGTKKVYRIAKKPVEMLKQEFYSKSDKNETGTEAAKLGLKTYDYAKQGAKTAVETGVKTVKNGAQLTKRVYKKLHKPTTAELKRTLRKRIYRNKLKSQVNYLAKQTVRKGTKAAGKAAANTAKMAAQAAQKAAQAAAKAITSAVTKIAGLIAETMPWSLIIIGAILIILIIALMFGSFLGGASGSFAGGGAWLVDDNSSQTPEEIYEGYKKFVEQAKEVMETQAKEALKTQVTSFCDSDTTAPRKIIQYIDKDNNILRYPASGADSTINPLIDSFGTEDYADYMSLLFVLMTREKQQADGVTDDMIYDFDFKKEDFEEFMKTVNENSCRWGDTFVIKTAVETSPEYCPGQSCKRKTKPGCKCSSYTDEGGKVHHYCGGHPYCPKNHTKLTVKLYTVKDYYNKEYPEIYNFTDNEKTRYEASKAIIQGMIDYWEGGNN